MGYSILKGYHLPPVNFTEEEACALATSGMFARYCSDDSMNRHMVSAMDKIRAVLRPAHRDQVMRLEHGLGATAIRASTEQPGLMELQKALSRRQAVRFSYQGHGQEQALVRVAEPLGLLHYLDRWHLIAWCRLRQDFRDFRTDRMRELEILPERFAPRDGFSLDAYIRQTMPPPGLRARVFFAAGSIDRAKREWWPGVEAQQPEPGGGRLDPARPGLGASGPLAALLRQPGHGPGARDPARPAGGAGRGSPGAPPPAAPSRIDALTPRPLPGRPHRVKTTLPRIRPSTMSRMGPRAWRMGTSRPISGRMPRTCTKTHQVDHVLQGTHDRTGDGHLVHDHRQQIQPHPGRPW